MVLTNLIGALAALSVAAGGSPRSRPGAAAARWRSGEAVPHLEVRPTLEGTEERTLTLPGAPAKTDAEPPPCVADYCQVRVEVPGMPTNFGRPHRSELFVALLDRAGIEPFATIAWAFVATGFRVDWAPPAFEGTDPATAHSGGWGSVFVRLRLRIDPMNHLVFPERNKSSGSHRSWTALVTPRA